MTDFQELTEAVAAVRRRGLGAVVGIGSHPPFGTGLVLAEGRILTSAHNLRWEGRSVHFADGRQERVETVVRDPGFDLAVATVPTGAVAPIAWGLPAVDLGRPVLAAARPGRQPLRLTVGLVSAVEEAGPKDAAADGGELTGWFEHTAPLPRGASGGPVFDASGAVVGVNTRRQGEGFYWALVVGADLRARLELLAAGGTPESGWLGVALLPPEMAVRLREAVGLEGRRGALVRQVVPGGPAEQAGLRRGDLLLRIGDLEMRSGRELRTAIAHLVPGSKIQVQLLRGAGEMTLEVTVASAPAGERRGWRGAGDGRRRRRGW
jgi:serine protease Do